MILIFRKKNAIITAILALIIGVMSFFVFSDVVPTAAANKKLPIYAVATEEQKVALTFDAAWGADKTRQIMDELEKFGVKGTFFLVGFWVDKYPELVKEIHERGHLIGNHSTNHLHMSKISQPEMEQEINLTSEKIEAIIGEKPAYFRAPFGEYDNKMIEFSQQSGFQVIQWDVDTLDWKGISGGQIADRVNKRVKAGSIILCHNNSDHIVEALPIILTGLKNKGLTAVRLDELVMKDGYHIDNNGLQIATR